MIKDQSTAEERIKGNLYFPFKSYAEYINQIVISAMEVNDIIDGIPVPYIADYWLICPLFRKKFKDLVFFAYIASYEGHLNALMPWCTFDIAKYAHRKFEQARKDFFKRIEKQSRGIYD